MKSKLTIDFRGLVPQPYSVPYSDQGFEPVIRFEVASTTDVRDKMCQAFIQNIGYNSNLLFIQNVSPGIKPDDPRVYMITPLPDEIRKEILRKELLQLMGSDSDSVQKIEDLFAIKKTENEEKDGPTAPITRTYKQSPYTVAELGVTVQISATAAAMINKPGYEQKYYTESVSVLMGIGNDHTADLIMTKDAWEALKAGAGVHFNGEKEIRDLVF